MNHYEIFEKCPILDEKSKFVLKCFVLLFADKLNQFSDIFN